MWRVRGGKVDGGWWVGVRNGGGGRVWVVRKVEQEVGVGESGDW